MTAVFPVGNGQCIALGYESVLPLVLLTLQGGDLKPYEFPTDGSKAMAGTGVFHSYFEPGRGGGGVLRISSEGDVRRIFGGWKLSFAGVFWVRKFGKCFFG